MVVSLSEGGASHSSSCRRSLATCTPTGAAPQDRIQVRRVRTAVERRHPLTGCLQQSECTAELVSEPANDVATRLRSVPPPRPRRRAGTIHVTRAGKQRLLAAMAMLCSATYLLPIGPRFLATRNARISAPAAECSSGARSTSNLRLLSGITLTLQCASSIRKLGGNVLAPHAAQPLFNVCAATPRAAAPGRISHAGTVATKQRADTKAGRRPGTRRTYNSPRRGCSVRSLAPRRRAQSPLSSHFLIVRAGRWSGTAARGQY